MNTLFQKTYPGVQARVSRIAKGGACDTHAMLRVSDPSLSYADQLRAVGDAIVKVSILECEGSRPVLVRLFVSDAANQGAMAKEMLGVLPCRLSIIEQPPLDGTKVAAWVWLMDGIEGSADRDGVHSYLRGGHEHLFAASMTSDSDDSYTQTRELLTGYAGALGNMACTLEANCVRTWFFVRDIDVNYGGMVRARNEVFADEGLTTDTHYIASTGIGGQTAATRPSVMMDAYAVVGLQPSQVKYLYAADNFNRTSDYGVAFERGVAIDYATHRHIMISGTASIDNRGQVVHAGDIHGQMARMCDNVEALLAEAGTTWDGVQHIILYLRDIADYAAAERYFEARFPDIPRVIVHARVCRPGWLVEMECMAMC